MQGRPAIGAQPHPLILLVAFGVLAAVSGIHPYDQADWGLEIAVPAAGAALLGATYRWFCFTPLAYRLMFLEALVLVVGAHYTHEHVPLFDWLKEPLGWQRNHYDRFAHFAVGFLLVIPFRELIVRLTPLRGRSAGLFAVISVLAMAAFYEITEWWIALAAPPELGGAYLGSQGDVWDAQQDMLMDLVGAIAGVLVLSRAHERALRDTQAARRGPGR